MLQLPFPITDVLKLADWLELYALISEDKNSSYVDLERILRREGIFAHPHDEDAKIEQKIQEVSYEIDLRSVAASEAYPFGIEERRIYLRDDLEQFVPYLFCLCLSFFENYEASNRKPYPRRMFEYLCCEAAKSYLGGRVIRFGFPRVQDEISPKFHLAVNDLCNHIGEGVGFRGGSAHSRKDDGIDIVAWRDFPDSSVGKLLLLGNCATGKNFDEKLNELQPLLFGRSWMVEIPISFMYGIKALFVPRRIERNNWSFISGRAGIIFDRCRIAYLVSISDELNNKEQYLKWFQKVLATEVK